MHYINDEKIWQDYRVLKTILSSFVSCSSLPPPSPPIFGILLFYMYYLSGRIHAIGDMILNDLT